MNSSSQRRKNWAMMITRLSGKREGAFRRNLHDCDRRGSGDVILCFLGRQIVCVVLMRFSVDSSRLIGMFSVDECMKWIAVDKFGYFQTSSYQQVTECNSSF